MKIILNFFIIFILFIPQAICEELSPEQLFPDEVLSEQQPPEQSQEETLMNYASGGNSPEIQFYTVGVGDLLDIQVYENPDLSGAYTVSADGSILFPILEEIDVTGITLAEIKDMITGMLEKDYLYDPIVTVNVKEYRSRKVKVTGGVSRPGVFFIDNTTRLFDVLSLLKNVREGFWASPNGNARIVRLNSGSVEVISINLEELLLEGNEEINVLLKDQDIIYMPGIGATRVYVLGEVKKPGAIPYDTDMTILKAISLAGGVTKRASVSNAFIKRIQDEQEIKIKVKMADKVLQPDDIIEVPLSFW